MDDLELIALASSSNKSPSGTLLQTRPTTPARTNGNVSISTNGRRGTILRKVSTFDGDGNRTEKKQSGIRSVFKLKSSGKMMSKFRV